VSVPEDGVASGRVSYTTKEILDGINDKLSRQALFVEQVDRRLTAVENRLGRHDEILTEQVPRLARVIEDLNVQQQVEAALEAKQVKGISRTDKIVGGAIGACVLLVTVIGNIPHITHG
jgi:hypothetical protein